MLKDGEVPTPEEEYGDEWEKLDKAEVKKPEGDTTDEDKAAAAAKEKEAEDLKAKEDADKKAAEDKSKDHGSTASMEKALKDTKQAFTDARKEIADLKKTVEDLKTGKATQADVDKAKQNVDAAKANLADVKTKVYKDYPELKDLLDPVLDQIDSLKRENEEAKQRAEQEKKEREKQESKAKEDGLLDEYNKNVLPKVQEAHKDFLDIIKDPEQEFFKWAEKQRPALRYAALNSMDPDDIIDAVGKYKEFKAKGAAAEDKTAEEKRKLEKQQLARSMPGGAPPAGSLKGKASDDKNDYDAGWEAAGKKLAKETVPR